MHTSFCRVYYTGKNIIHDVKRYPACKFLLRMCDNDSQLFSVIQTFIATELKNVEY